MTDDDFMSEAKLCQRLGVSRQTGARRHKHGDWPTRTWISPRRWGYSSEEVKRWIANKSRDRDTD
jgi:predicted DNA-binding transcriptional regulator AlpA